MAIQKLVMAMQEVELALEGIEAHGGGAKMAQLEWKLKHIAKNEYLDKTSRHVIPLKIEVSTIIIFSTGRCAMKVFSLRRCFNMPTH